MQLILYTTFEWPYFSKGSLYILMKEFNLLLTVKANFLSQFLTVKRNFLGIPLIKGTTKKF